MQSLSSSSLGQRGPHYAQNGRLWKKNIKEPCAIPLGGTNLDQARAPAGIYPDYFVREHSSGQLISQGLAHSLLDCVVPTQHSENKGKTIAEVIYTADLLDSPFTGGRGVYKVLLPHASSPALINITMKLVHSEE